VTKLSHEFSCLSFEHGVYDKQPRTPAVGCMRTERICV